MQSKAGDSLISDWASDRLIAAHDGDVALLYVYMLRTGCTDTEQAARALCRTLSEMDSAEEKLRRMELIPIAARPLADRPAPAEELRATLAKQFMVDYDETGSIGKRYRRQDEIGTPFCITYDFESEEDKAVTIRHRDTMEQVRVPMADVAAWLAERVAF